MNNHTTGLARMMAFLVLKLPFIHFFALQIVSDVFVFKSSNPCPTASNMLQRSPPCQFAHWLWIEAKCVRYFYPESMISLDLSWCGLLAKAIACTWPVCAGGVGTQPWVLREGWREGGRRGRWRQGVGGRVRGGGAVVDGRIPLRVHENKRGGWMWVRQERKQIRKWEREEEELKGKHNYSDSEQLATENLLPVWRI